ncbi:MAG: DUF3626 domain-containing protein, partial [Mailhella sp.]|nr:DUF3626 domain-containing protein [Mailhella sp.]
MVSGIQWDKAVQQDLASRGVNESTGIYGNHTVKLAKGSSIRLDQIKSASMPYEGFKTATKIARGKAGVQQSAGDTLKTLAKPGTLDIKQLLGHLKAMQTQYERLDKLGQLSEEQKESKLWMFTSHIESLTNEELAAVYQGFTSAEMDLLQTALLREAQFSAEASDASNAADALFDLQALVIREISIRSSNAQIDDMAAESEELLENEDVEALRPESLTEGHGGSAQEDLHVIPGAQHAPDPHGMSAYSLHTLAEAASASATQREKNAVLEQSKLSARKLDNVTLKQMGDVLRNCEMTINIDTEYLIGGDNSVFGHPNDPMVNIFHLADQGIKPKGDGYLEQRNASEQYLFPALKGHKRNANERPLYAALNINGRKGGALNSSYGYGSSAIVLKPHVARRATYTVDDSFISGKISITEERRQNFYRLLDGSKLPQDLITALKDPNSPPHRNFEEYLDLLAGMKKTDFTYFDRVNSANYLSPELKSLIHSGGNLQQTENNWSRFTALCIMCFGDSEATQNAIATYDNLENLVTNMTDVDANALSYAAQKKAAGRGQNAVLLGAQYIEAQIHGPVIPSRDIAEIRINLDDVPEDEQPALREQARQYEKDTGIKITLMKNFEKIEEQDDTFVDALRNEERSYNTAHMDMPAIEALKQEYVQHAAEKIQENLYRSNQKNGLPPGALRLEGNALQVFLSKFVREIDRLVHDSDSVFATPEHLVKNTFNNVLNDVIPQKAELLRELEAIAQEEPPMTPAQKEAVTKWIVSAKALRSPEELRIIIKHAKAQAQLMREIGDAEPPLTPDQIFRRMAALGTGINTDLAAYMKSLPPDKEFGEDEKSNEMDRISFMSLALVQHGEPPMDKAELEKLNARIAGPQMSAFLGQLEALIRDDDIQNLQGFSALSQLKTQMWLNAVNIGPLAGKRFPDPVPFAGEFSLMQEP